jgi:hypothetical protein
MAPVCLTQPVNQCAVLAGDVDGDAVQRSHSIISNLGTTEDYWSKASPAL